MTHRPRFRRMSAVRPALVAALLLAHCGGGGSPSEPAPAGDGILLFTDSGCACGTQPFPPIPIYIDNRLAGNLPVFGKLSLPLPAGVHTWASYTAAGPTSVTIRQGATLTINLIVNDSCTDGCDAGDPPP